MSEIRTKMFFIGKPSTTYGRKQWLGRGVGVSGDHEWGEVGRLINSKKTFLVNISFLEFLMFQLATLNE